MPKPANKAQLMEACRAEYDALEALLAPLEATRLTQPGALGEWSAKDVLAHLYEWQQMMFGWREAGQRGQPVQTPGRGYKWNQLPALNQAIYEQYRDTPLAEVLFNFRASHRHLMALIEATPEEDLFAAGAAPWMGSHSLATFIHANGSNHYHWALAEMRKHFKKAPTG